MHIEGAHSGFAPHMFSSAIINCRHTVQHSTMSLSVAARPLASSDSSRSRYHYLHVRSHSVLFCNRGDEDSFFRQSQLSINPKVVVRTRVKATAVQATNLPKPVRRISIEWLCDTSFMSSSIAQAACYVHHSKCERIRCRIAMTKVAWRRRVPAKYKSASGFVSGGPCTEN